MAKVKQFFIDHLHWFVVGGVALLCTLFLVFGHPNAEGYYTIGGEVTITETTKDWIESANEALYRVMNENAPTDEATVKEYEDGFGEGLGGSTTLDTVISRRKPDGDNDNGNGWQCSKYTAYLATGRKDYSSAHPDYGPVNGKNIAQWLVNNFGWKYIDEPVAGAIGSGGFNTLYGHTAMFLYWISDGVAMVNDANYTPLAVNTHPMNTAGWVWVVPGDYTPDPTPTPTPTPSGSEVTYTYVPGDYFSGVLVKLGLDEGNLWGTNGTVVYYTNQLIEQNMLNSRGNVYLGIPFTLTKR